MKAYIHCNPVSNEADIYKTEGEHLHTRPARDSRGLSDLQKQTVRELYDSGITVPTNILLQLAFKGMPVQKAKLINFLAQYKKLKFGDCTIQLHTIHDWCKLNSAIPESEDDVFVPNYQVEADEFDKPL